jgi:hypothetical protein
MGNPSEKELSTMAILIFALVAYIVAMLPVLWLGTVWGWI